MTVYALLIQVQNEQRIRCYKSLEAASNKKRLLEYVLSGLMETPLAPRIQVFAGESVRAEEVENYIPVEGDKYVVSCRGKGAGAREGFFVADTFDDACGVIGAVIDESNKVKLPDDALSIALLAGTFVEPLEQPLDKGDDQRAEQLDQKQDGAGVETFGAGSKQ